MRLRRKPYPFKIGNVNTVVGISAFERPKRPTRQRAARLFCSGKGISAEGFESNEGFVVVEGSQAHGQTVRSMATRVPGYPDLRNGLVEAGVLVPEGEHFRFAQDYSFNSPSAAAAVILGRSANGRREWTDKQGRQLRAIQEAAVANPSE